VTAVDTANLEDLAHTIEYQESVLATVFMACRRIARETGDSEIVRDLVGLDDETVAALPPDAREQLLRLKDRRRGAFIIAAIAEIALDD
jgi:hypothetical protein